MHVSGLRATTATRLRPLLIRGFAVRSPGGPPYLRGTAKNERDAERLRVKLRAQVNARRSTATRVWLAYARPVREVHQPCLTLGQI